MNVIARLEYELAYYDSAVHRFNHYTTRTPHFLQYWWMHIYLPPITKTIQVRRTSHAGHCWRSRDELIIDVLLWTPTHGRAKAGRTARTYIQQLCEDTGCSPEYLPGAMNDREKWRERVRDIGASGTTWWWWWGWYMEYFEEMNLGSTSINPSMWLR